MGREEKLKKIASDVRWEVKNRLYPSVDECSNASLISLVMSLAAMKDKIEEVMVEKTRREGRGT